MSAADCIFCKIVNEQIPCFKLFECEHTFAFMDINPVHDGHCLVIPKRHSENLLNTPTVALQATIATAQRLATAVQAALSPAGFNLFQANGAAAGQTVFHFHIHVLPRVAGDNLKMDWGQNPGDMTAIAGIAERIKAQL